MASAARSALAASLLFGATAVAVGTAAPSVSTDEDVVALAAVPPPRIVIAADHPSSSVDLRRWMRAAGAQLAAAPELDMMQREPAALGGQSFDSAIHAIGRLSFQSFHGSGPYRGIYSAHGYSAIESRIYLPCTARYFPDKYKIGGFAYLGGWGSGGGGSAVDAGFQTSIYHDGYKLFLNVEGAWVKHRGEYVFKCDQDVTLTYYVVPGPLRQLKVTARGSIYSDPEDIRNTPNPALTTVAIATAAAQYDGWDPAGGSDESGDIVKRMTSIGEPLDWFGKTGTGADVAYYALPGEPWLSNGAYFGHAAGQRTALLRWYDTRVGYYQGVKQSMVCFSHSTQLGSDTYPNDGRHVIVEKSTSPAPRESCPAWDESDAVDLTQ